MFVGWGEQGGGPRDARNQQWEVEGGDLGRGESRRRETLGYHYHSDDDSTVYVEDRYNIITRSENRITVVITERNLFPFISFHDDDDAPHTQRFQDFPVERTFTPTPPTTNHLALSRGTCFKPVFKR